MNLSVTNSPFTEGQAAQINELLQTLTPEQKVWLSGYLVANQQLTSNGTVPSQTGSSSTNANGLTEGTEAMLQQNEPVITPEKRAITLLYGSETGNAQGLAEIFEERLSNIGHNVTLKAMDDFKPKNLKNVEDLFIITSTQGEGDPPDNAAELHEFIHGRKAPKLEGVRFSVLALGDQTYEYFCQTGRDFDRKLDELGAERIYDRVDCDVDYEEDAEKWMANVINAIDTAPEGTQNEQIVSESIKSAKEKKFSKANPYQAEVLENINLNGQGSNKETRHIEFLLDNFGEDYEVGDCLVVLPQNDPALVDLLISTLGWDPNDQVQISDEGDTLGLEEALTTHFEITKLTKPLLINAASFFENEELNEKVEDNEWVQSYIEGRDLIDLLNDFATTELQPENLYQLLRKLPPREYSISSSYEALPDEVHITVGAVRYNSHGRDRSGVCSVQFAERIQPGDTVPIYLKRNPNFKFPKEADTPVIMIGPGTGVAPFRAYMQEREEHGFKGNTWLFFGDQHFTTDFLYQTEWQEWLKDGVLGKMDVAFSRDTDEKVYVQHRIAEHSKEFNEWLQNGASIYICGDEKHMAKDVHQAIRNVLVKEQNLSEEDAEAYLKQMKKDKRYQRDVY
ncbi:assimilatory sulfite reductase (NADPH) flavoprotein subunit [Staphylococcus haemolyticus]|uniref:assimilatory sulfite reductase (NADPH) flavoprotein subunit n=1 Tax=Staphylococcus haemolyticus TaxID=1283 RepID=UPI00069E40A5|nr:assimilatory sulfite reductase (NADPH) flavoprotein subunit [Staphylococcus haemolyticus]MCH4533035.1 assimilatory sulfite reductase (NADPH) flavoprotein subunit [Staphylococcus haemolyticus]PTK85351.1 assimilatory sulfite reductase (NADPH) flavoprotein subunit [Staphylococcus haemolyticus]PTL05211.1 assimilatory sulfite reductase (NADPH) flavoprotein subunit [Staphylococcus haemolyticus]PTL15758.1 assimilatory sulfite reductase (NADPH) flavoprotein subunit [Staphylococcus haemolyticus]UVD8